jgi:tRNA wybutosine-synthesizing protein 1
MSLIPDIGHLAPPLTMSVILSTLYSLLTYSSYVTSLLLGFVIYAVIRWYTRVRVGETERVQKKQGIEEDTQVKDEKVSDKKSCEKGDKCCGGCKKTKSLPVKDKIPSLRVVILYGTTTGNSKSFSESLCQDLAVEGIEVAVKNCADFDKNIDEEVQKLKSDYDLMVLIISTYTDGTPPESCSWFYTWLQDLAGDFRVNHTMLEPLKFCVFGLGNSLYEDNYNVIAKNVDSFLSQLSADRFVGLGLGDENVAESKQGSIEKDFQVWKEHLISRITKKENPIKLEEKGAKPSSETADSNAAATVVGGEGSSSSGFSSEEEEDSEEEAEGESEEEEGDGLVDLEDLGAVLSKGRNHANKIKSSEPKEMVTPSLRKSLTKQGYKIIGSHSGVKLCRWTKSMLRGRGGCYKHTFYGIESHRCMETTPSLACANKCVFCWRHHSNPVGTEWRWKMDPAETILEGALENHYKMINEFKGVPGVLPDKLAEGMKAKHCALSLVGEPIMYPEINKFVKLLHSQEISSFLVTNAQFPDAIRDMSPCTQLYVSIDASTKESLKAIDRPLFKDYWERFIQSLKELAHKGQRTVYRLTLVKGWNAEEMDNYAALVQLGLPDFIEIKGVTYCGSSKASTLTMENVPWHEEVVKFVKELVTRLPDYEISCEHEHSNCLLVTNKKYKIDGKWHTWIDYDRFQNLVEYFYETGETFTGLDYMQETPSWAEYGNNAQGFDPNEKRWKRKGKVEVNVDGGCG